MTLFQCENNRVDYYFQSISKIPRGSYHESQICDYIEDFAKSHQLHYKRDELNNIIVYKEASKGYEDHQPVMLEAHMDMVCEKNHDSDHDFDYDPIELIEKEGYLYANKTTLGADDGVGVVYMLAILENPTLSHPPLECVFTVQEEVGLFGAMNIKKEDIHATRMIGLDSGEENHLCTTSSGGRRVVLDRTVSFQDNQKPCYSLQVEGLLGGHSGGVIHLERASANKVMGRILYHLSLKYNLDLCQLQGGLKENAIARESACVFASESDFEMMLQDVDSLTSEIQQEFHETEPTLTITLKKTTSQNQSIQDSQDIIELLFLLPHGFLHKSLAMNLTMASLNLGVMSLTDKMSFYYSIRSPMTSRRDEVSLQLQLLCQHYHFDYHQDSDYPGWPYQKESPFSKHYLQYVKDQEGIELVQEGTHGGLETGIFKGLIPELEIITMGPDMDDIHTPDERLDIASFHRVYQRLVGFLTTL